MKEWLRFPVSAYARLSAVRRAMRQHSCSWHGHHAILQMKRIEDKNRCEACFHTRSCGHSLLDAASSISSSVFITVKWSSLPSSPPVIALLCACSGHSAAADLGTGRVRRLMKHVSLALHCLDRKCKQLWYNGTSEQQDCKELGSTMLAAALCSWDWQGGRQLSEQAPTKPDSV